MDLEKISLIESKISELGRNYSALKAELRKQKEEVSRLREDANRARILDKENAKLLKRQAQARSKIETILQKLEGFDFK